MCNNDTANFGQENVIDGAAARSPSDKFELTVLAPCFNEAKNIPELVSRLCNVFQKKGINGEIVLVDDASTDDTRAVMKRLAEEYTQLSLVYHQRNQGIAAAWRSGLQAARGEYVCLIDADLQNLPEDVWRLYREIKFTNADMVQGYRSSIGRLKDSRYLLSRGLNFILNSLFSMNLRDNKSGFVIAPREVMQDVIRFQRKYNFANSFIAVSAHSKGYSIREIETLFQNRMMGVSYLARFPIRAVVRCFADLVPAFMEFRVSTKNENLLQDFLKSNKPTRSDEPLTGWRKWGLDLFFKTMPLHKWLITSKARNYYDELKQSQWLTLAQIRELQEQKLRKLVRHAYQHVPFYRQRFDEAGIKPTDIRTLDDLTKIPLLSKQDVRENLYFDLMSDNHKKSEVLRIQTSGSTGEPFVCFADRHQLEIRWAATQRSLEWTGYRFGDKQARLWHQTIGMSFLQVAREKLDALINRRLFVPAYELSDNNLRLFIEKIVKHQPVLIDGYAESLNFLAHYVKEHGIPGFRPKALVSSAQALPDQSREIIEKAFGCKVFDKYGSREFSGIAYECEEHDGHHVVAESYIVEILKDGRPARPGEVGEIVITDLSNHCLPFLRYRIGDLAVAVDNNVTCGCGRGLPRIGKIEGRVQAIIVGTNGNYVPGTFFAHLFKDYDCVVRQYQVVQEEVGSIKLKVIKASAFNDEAFGEVLRELRKFLGADMRIDVEFVDNIPMVRTGKRQGSISKIQMDFQQIEAPVLATVGAEEVISGNGGVV
jgi:phenylacetate-CoA ligase